MILNMYLNDIIDATLVIITVKIPANDNESFKKPDHAQFDSNGEVYTNILTDNFIDKIIIIRQSSL